jgi:hypothetical protein
MPKLLDSLSIGLLMKSRIDKMIAYASFVDKGKVTPDGI